jgi:hypothetical protein
MQSVPINPHTILLLVENSLTIKQVNEFSLIAKYIYIYILANFRDCGQAILNNRNECGLQRRHLYILIK